MNHAAQGADALAASDAAAAVLAYTKALIEHPTSPDYLVQRSTAFTRLKPARHDLALKDAEHAVLFARERAKRDKIQIAQLRRAISLHGVGSFADAKFVLETMVKWRGKDDKKGKMEGDMWMARVENKLKAIPREEQVVTVKEYPEVELPTELQMKAMLKKQLKPDGTFKFEEHEAGIVDEKETGKFRTPKPDEPAATITDTKTTTTTPITSTPTPSRIRHEWYQNLQSIIVTLYAKGVPKDRTKADIQVDSVFISFPHPSSLATDSTFSLDPLFAFIDPASSKCTVTSTKVELILQKAITGQKWPNLEGTIPLRKVVNGRDAAAKAAVMSILQHRDTSEPATAPTYPTSSRTGPKNWDKLATDLTAKKKKTTKGSHEFEGGASDVSDVESEYGGDEVDSFFKKLYAGADDDTKRAMMKSFQESNGTSLSTNWSEVGKKTVAPIKDGDDDGSI